MTIEEIENEWAAAESQTPDCSDSEWAQKHARKLIAVAKAAKILTEILYCRGFWNNNADDLNVALEELEK